MENVEDKMDKFKILNNLVELPLEELSIIYNNIANNTKNIQLLDYINMINLDDDKIVSLKEAQEKQITKDRRVFFDKYNKVVNSSKIMEHKLSLLRLNPYTKFENNPYLFFGIGGGSKALCKGLPFDVLAMILTGENMRRKIGIKRCRILLANRITYTNIARNKEFSQESIDRVMKVEKEIILKVLKKFDIIDYWDVILQTDIQDILGYDGKEEYEKFISNADTSKIVGGHHYSIEMADIYSLVGHDSGGIKLGWFIRNLDKKNGGYIMDEQPFHARYVLFMAEQNKRNKVTLAYVNAGARLYPGPTGHLEKESPYICYDPQNRLLLSPFERPIEKLKKATLSGGAFQYRYYRKLMNGIIELFEELILTPTGLEKINRIPTSGSSNFRGNGIAEKIEFILNYIFKDEDKYKYEKLWQHAFGEQREK